MYYVPVTESYYKTPSSYIPVYPTRLLADDSNTIKLNKVQKELSELREELNGLRLEKETCRICSSRRSSSSPVLCDETCSICYPKVSERYENYSRITSPVHYCSICQDYVIDQEYPPPPSSRSSSPRLYRKSSLKKKTSIEQEDKLSEYLSRQLDLQRLRQRYIPEERPVWIPTAYKHDYPHRRWTTRHSHLSEP